MKSDKEVLVKMKNYCEEVIEHSQNLDFETFCKDKIIQYACLFPLLQLGELSNKLSSELVVKAGIPRREMSALRNRIVHGYGSINFKIIWELFKMKFQN